MNLSLLAGALGGLVAFALAIPSIVLEIKDRGRVKDLPLVVDVRTVFGKKLNARETFAAALLLHVVIGFAFGAMYALFALRGWLFVTHAPFSFLSLVVYAVGAFLVLGLVVFPALGMGLFARKEGKRAWLELLLSMLVNGVGLWLLMRWMAGA